MVTVGIDIGTTSIKISVVKDDDLSVVANSSAPHHSAICCANKKYHEQNALKICDTVLSLLEQCKLPKIDHITVSGQMHGVILWENKSLLEYEYGRENSVNCSNLITWMDQRCSNDFLNTIPKWINEEGKEESKISTGYGLATLAWLKLHGLIHKLWDRSGTIMDFLVALITKSSDSFISDQNAYSWGYRRW